MEVEVTLSVIQYDYMKLAPLFSLLVCLWSCIPCALGRNLILKSVSHTAHEDPLQKLLASRGGNNNNFDELLSNLDWRFFLAGGICAAFSHGITTPIGSNYSSKFIVAPVYCIYFYFRCYKD